MSEINAIRIKTEPDPMEPFFLSQGFRVGNLICLSGQAAIDQQGNIVGENDFDKQAEQTFLNIKQLLETAGSSLQQVVKVTIYLTDMTNFLKIIELRQRWFKKPYPADTIVEVKSLALPELLIEIDATALAKGKLIDR
jgi:reactive intermediate/imine deaminase